jgi:hypothetical protein
MRRALDPSQPRWTRFSYHQRCWELKSTRTLVATRSLTGTVDRLGRDDNVGKHGRLCRPAVLGGRLGGDPESVPGKFQRVYLTSILTPLLTPTDPNITRRRPTRFDEDTLEIPVWQSILRHDSTPRYPLASLEQNPAYGTAPTSHIYVHCGTCSQRAFLQSSILPGRSKRL